MTQGGARLVAIGRVRVTHLWVPQIHDYECTDCGAWQAHGRFAEFETHYLIGDMFSAERRLVGTVAYWQGSKQVMGPPPCRKCGGRLKTRRRL